MVTEVVLLLSAVPVAFTSAMVLAMSVATLITSCPAPAAPAGNRTVTDRLRLS